MRRGVDASCDPADPPWWWITDAERRALGLGASVIRTPDGFLFGDETADVRVEVVARDEQAPVRMGSISLRYWGAPPEVKARRVLEGVARALYARRAIGFAPERVSFSGIPSDAHATVHLDVPSVCERACVFCDQSRRPQALRTPHDDGPRLDAAIEALVGEDVVLTGDDALSHPDIVGIVGRASARARRVSVIGPPRATRTAALATHLADAGLHKYQTGLFGGTAEVHDAIAGARGSFAAVAEAAHAFRTAGVQVELVTPLVTQTLPHLVAIARHAATLTPSALTLLTYAPDVSVGTHFDAVVPGFASMREALAGLFAARLDPEPTLDALPHCVVPEARRATLPARLDRTDSDLAVVHPDATCASCTARARCPGTVSTVLRAVGASGLVPLRLAR